MTKGPILFYVVLFIYLAGMAGMALYGLKQKGKAAKGQELEVHFLANKGFGSVVIFFNVVATFLTGWVVTGIPSDAAGSGYIQFMWLLCCSCAGSTFNLLWPRWRRCAVNRNYMGPGDWYGDRYNSKCLVLLCSLAGCCFMITQQILEWMALKAIFQTITKGDIDGNLAVWLLAGFVFCCEMIGGMTSVALTDAIQASILLCCYLMMPILCQAVYGGYEGVGLVGCQNEFERKTAWPDLPPAWGSLTEITIGCNDTGPSIGPDSTCYNSTMSGCLQHNQAWFFMEPPAWAAPFMFSFALMATPWSIPPFSIHRILVAENDEAISNGVALVHAYPYCFFTPGILLGLTAAAVFPEKVATGSAFAIMAEAFMDKGGGYAFIAILLLTSCVASFMSTADSIVLATSNQLTIDFFRGWLAPNATAKQTLIFSKMVSALLIILSVCVANYSVSNFMEILNYGLGLLNCCFPVVFYGMFFNVHSRAAICGFLGAFLAMIVCQSISMKCVENWPYEDGDMGPYGIGNGPMGIGCTGMLSGAVSLVSGMVIIPVMEMLFQEHAPEWCDDSKPDRWDAILPQARLQWGKEVLTGTMIRKYMREGQEPVQTVLGKAMWCFAYFVPLLLCPWYGKPGETYAIIGGMPSFAARMVFGNLMCTTILIVQSFYWWKGPEAKERDDQLAKDGSLTPFQIFTRMGLQYETPAEGMRRLSTAMLEGTINVKAASNSMPIQVTSSNQVAPMAVGPTVPTATAPGNPIVVVSGTPIQEDLSSMEADDIEEMIS